MKRFPHWWLLLFLILPIASWVVLQLFLRDQSLAEAYARNVYPIVTFIPRTLSGLVPFSLSEWVVLLGALVLLTLLIESLIRLIRGPNRKRLLLRWGKGLFIAFCVLYPVFMLNFGYTYHRNSLAQNLQLTVQDRSSAELAEAVERAVTEVNQLAGEVGRDEEGLFRPNLSQKEILTLADNAYQTRAENSSNEYLKNYFYLGDAAVKPVLSSYLWSYTGITGIFVPFLMESNVNVSVRPDEMMFTALHEVAHSFGIAREDEANFLAFYAGILHENPEMRYSAWLMGFTHLNNALYSADSAKQAELWQELDGRAQDDLAARNAFWKQFEGPVQEVSNQINDSYLKANKQEDGVKSYGRVVDLILAYFAEGSNG